MQLYKISNNWDASEQSQNPLQQSKNSKKDGRQMDISKTKDFV